MASEVFDRLFVDASQRIRDAHEIAMALYDPEKDVSRRELYRFAGKLAEDGKAFFRWIDAYAKRQHDRVDFARKLAGKPPLNREQQDLLLLIFTGKSIW